METRGLIADDLEAAFQMNEEYLGASRADFFEWYALYPDLFVGIFDRNALLGICYGMDWDREPGYVILQGIATRYSHWRSGAGSQLIRYFHEKVRNRGKQRVTVGVAEDIKTENFYLKNGYLPVQLCAKVPSDDLPVDFQALGYDFAEVRDEGGYTILYATTDGPNKSLQQKLKTDLRAEEVIFIMEIALGRDPGSEGVTGAD
jgi:GNAT superfamily N-acetyltransferase